MIPELVLCACILHNICIDAGDVNDEEDAAVRDGAEARADRAEINAACGRIFRNNGKIQIYYVFMTNHLKNLIAIFCILYFVFCTLYLSRSACCS